MMKMSALALGSLALLGAALLTGQSAVAQKASPAAKAECKFSDGKTITISYSSPRMKGRKIFGDLVPFGQVWRTGADEATTFVVSGDVNVGGKAVPAGNYTLYTLPNAAAWSLIVSKKTGQWGIPYPGDASDLTRAPMTVSKLPSPVENFTISLKQAGNTCSLQMDWETTRASIDIKR